MVGTRSDAAKDCSKSRTSGKTRVVKKKTTKDVAAKASTSTKKKDPPAAINETKKTDVTLDNCNVRATPKRAAAIAAEAAFSGERLKPRHCSIGENAHKLGSKRVLDLSDCPSPNDSVPNEREIDLEKETEEIKATQSITAKSSVSGDTESPEPYVPPPRSDESIDFAIQSATKKSQKKNPPPVKAITANKRKEKKKKKEAPTNVAGMSVRPRNFSKEEDLMICQAFVNVSHDPITGSDQIERSSVTIAGMPEPQVVVSNGL
jgi:hypothetical protein